MGHSREPLRRAAGTFSCSVARRLRDARGIALVTAVILLALMSGIGTTVVAYSSSNSRASSLSATEKEAYALAEAGMNLARSTLFQAPSFSSPSAVPEQTLSMGGGTVTYSGTLAGSTWTLSGSGSLPNPTGPGTVPVTRTVSSQVSVTTALQSSSNNAVWNYLYADDPNTCTHFHNNATISVPTYTRGSLCLENNATFNGPLIEVEQTVSIQNNASIGTSGSSIQQANVAGGCRYASGPLHSPCTASDRVYAQTITTTPSGYHKPPVDIPYWYQNADLGPTHNCTTGSFPGGFDNDSTMNTSRATLSLIPTTSYDCRRVVNGQTVGQLTWTPGQGNTCGTLIIVGTVFFDGSISMSNNRKGCYQGRGTIYTSGTLSLENNVYLCGISSCTASWNPSQNLLAVVAGSSTASIGISFRNNADFQGALYAVTDYLAENNSDVWGPVIARQIEVENNGANYAPIGQLLPAMPAEYQQVPTLVNVEGSYTG